MTSKQFSLRLAVRLLILSCLMYLAVWLISQSGYYASAFLSAVIFFIGASELWHFIRRTNHDIARFLGAARYADYSQNFSLKGGDTGFAELGATFNDILERMRAHQSEQKIEVQKLKAMIEHSPVPLLTVHGDDSIELHNNAVRRLFESVQVRQLKDLEQFGKSFQSAIANALPDKRELLSYTFENTEYQLALATTESTVAGQKSRMISLQNIQSELDTTQGQAWQDLVRVLTHEIMNSITPITSLASTALDLSEDLHRRADKASVEHDELNDLRDALSTMARRSSDLLDFVESYREFQRVAPPEKKLFAINAMFESVGRLAKAEWPDCDTWLSFTIKHHGLEIYADQSLLEPVLLNLIRNAYQATHGLGQREIELRGYLDRRGNAVIEISDNGPGIEENIAKKIFVPFFTTKQDGSGVGLALARQVMTAHGGFIQVGQSKTGGAKFSLTF